MDFEIWDRLIFRDFGYEHVFDVRRLMVQVGADVVFRDQGVTVTLVDTQLADIPYHSLNNLILG